MRIISVSLGESLNAVFRDGCLDRWSFLSPHEAKAISENFKQEYSAERPHGALGGLAPEKFALGCAQSNQPLAA